VCNIIVNTTVWLDMCCSKYVLSLISNSECDAFPTQAGVAE